MTIQEAYKKITSSEDLKKKAIEALKAGKANEFLKEQGIDLTIEQINEALKAKKTGELSREELDMAAGGGCQEDICNAVWSGMTYFVGCLVSDFITNEKNLCW